MNHPTEQPFTRPKEDSRPQRYGWAPGKYLNDCPICAEQFIGDKRANLCADCAYALPAPSEKSPAQPPELTAERLEELKALMSLASPLPWPDPDTDEDFTCSEEEMQHNRRFIWALCNNAGTLFAQLHSLRSELATAKERIGGLEKRQWQDISTAPKDGTEIILYSPEYTWHDAPCVGQNSSTVPERVTSGQWIEHEDPDDEDNDQRGWSSLDGGFTDEYPPTHWQPLPEPPTSEGESHE